MEYKYTKTIDSHAQNLKVARC